MNWRLHVHERLMSLHFLPTLWGNKKWGQRETLLPTFIFSLSFYLAKRKKSFPWEVFPSLPLSISLWTYRVAVFLYLLFVGTRTCNHILVQVNWKTWNSQVLVDDLSNSLKLVHQCDYQLVQFSSTSFWFFPTFCTVSTGYLIDYPMVLEYLW